MVDQPALEIVAKRAYKAIMTELVALRVGRHASLRLMVGFLAWGYVQVLGHALRALICVVVPPGDSGLFSGLMGGQAGETWVIAFVVVTLVEVLGEAALLWWAVRPPPAQIEQTDRAWTLAFVGLGGLGARAMVYGGSFGMTTLLAREGVERIAAYSVANSITSMVHSALLGLVLLGALLYLADAAARKAHEVA